MFERYISILSDINILGLYWTAYQRASPTVTNFAKLLLDYPAVLRAWMLYGYRESLRGRLMSGKMYNAMFPAGVKYVTPDRRSPICAACDLRYYDGRVKDPRRIYADSFGSGLYFSRSFTALPEKIYAQSMIYFAGVTVVNVKPTDDAYVYIVDENTAKADTLIVTSDD